MQHIQDPFLVLEIVELFFAHDSAVDPPNEYHFNTHVILFLSLNIQLVVCTHLGHLSSIFYLQLWDIRSPTMGQYGLSYDKGKFRLVKNPRKVVIVTSGDTTTVRLYPN